MTTVWDGKKDVAIAAFDVSIAWNDKAMARFVRALVAHRGHFTDSFTFSRPPHGRNDTTIFRVFLPESKVDAFRVDAQPQDMRLPPVIHLNSALEDK